jgi:hypothetical protein
MALRLRRGTDAERLLITPLAGELIYTTDTKLLYVGDGTTIGGTLVTGSGGGGGATTLDALTDTDLTGAANGDVLAYNAGTNKWQPAEIPGLSAFSLDDLDDVFINTGTLTRGQILRYDGINWTPQDAVEEFGSFKINILGDDSSVIVNTLNNTVTGNFVGELVGTVIGVLDGEMKGSVFSDDSTLLVDGVSSKIVGDIESVNAILTNNLIIEGTGGIIINTNQSSEDPFDLFSVNASVEGSAGSNIIFSRSRGTLSAKTALEDEDEILTMTWFGTDTDGAPALSAALSGFVQGSPSSGVVPGGLALATTDSAGNLNVALTVSSDTVTRFNGAVTLVSYADATARDAAIVTPEPGMMIYLTSTNKAQVYDGTIWNDLY